MNAIIIGFCVNVYVCISVCLCGVQAHDIGKQLHDMNLRDVRGKTIGKVLNTPQRCQAQVHILAVFAIHCVFMWRCVNYTGVLCSLLDGQALFVQHWKRASRPNVHQVKLQLVLLRQHRSTIEVRKKLLEYERHSKSKPRPIGLNKAIVIQW